jgi:hypothetical protein
MKISPNKQKLNNSLSEKIERSNAIDAAMRQCGEILKCPPNDVLKRVQKMATQLKQCEEIIGALNG